MDKTEFAFPQWQSVGSVAKSEGGVTLRDYFAAKAMQSIIISYPNDAYCLSAEAAYDMADAMLEARGK